MPTHSSAATLSRGSRQSTCSSWERSDPAGLPGSPSVSRTRGNCASQARPAPPGRPADQNPYREFRRRSARARRRRPDGSGGCARRGAVRSPRQGQRVASRVRDSAVPERAKGFEALPACPSSSTPPVFRGRETRRRGTQPCRSRDEAGQGEGFTPPPTRRPLPWRSSSLSWRTTRSAWSMPSRTSLCVFGNRPAERQQGDAAQEVPRGRRRSGVRVRHR